MSDLTVAVTFTKNTGQPATGLTLAEINIWLTAQNRATGATTIIWATQNPTKEIDNVGNYIRIYTDADLDTYNYFAAAQYTGAENLDASWAVGVASINNIPVGTAVEYTYTVTNSVTGDGIEGVNVWFYADSDTTNLVWYGVTDTFGVARDNYDKLPRLDPGTYYIKVQRAGFEPDDSVDTEVVS